MMQAVPSDLIDAAWKYVKENQTLWARGARRAMKVKLMESFPDAKSRQLSHACLATKRLLDVCYDVGDACRHEAITRAESENLLAEKFPGFSPKTYHEAVSYGMFISR